MPSQSKLLGDLISAAGTVSVSGSNLVANTVANSAFQTGSVENYFNAQGLSIGRNRIINGAMVIAQRATTANNVGSSAYATLDRFVLDTRINASPTGSYTQAQSTDAPTGFNYSFSVTVTTAGDSLNSAFGINLAHFIEGYNIADLAWGTASAQTITLSFWVKSSITGSYGFGLISGSYDAAYVGQYTVISANTWEKKTVTIPGPTIGTWDKTTGRGIQLKFSLGTGSGAVTATPNTWLAGEFLDASSSTASPTFWSTAGAVLKITGVQLEVGSTATPFERRMYGQELALCQRYYQTLPFDAGFISVGATIGTGSVRGPLFQLNQNMRVAPTVTLPATGSAAGQLHYTNSSGSVPATIGTNGVLGVQVNSFRVEGDGYNSAFTAGQAVMLRVGTGGGASITTSAEL